MAKTTFDTNPVLLQTLLKNCEDGKLQLPDFQRSWVWEEERIMSLIASISRGFPMGALMSLKSKIDTGVVFACRPIEGAPVVAPTKPEQLLLDGQQRMTSLYGVVRGKPPKFFDGNAQAFTGLRFHLGEEVFAFYQPVKMKDDPLWFDVTSLLGKGSIGLGEAAGPNIAAVDA
jgi:hypothetical protein